MASNIIGHRNKAKRAGSSGKKANRGKGAKRRSGIVRRAATLVRWSLIAAIWGFIALGSVLAWYAYGLPDIEGISQATRPPGITLVAADGTPISSSGEIYGRSVTVAELPPALPRAVLAVEDRRFYQHWGIDPRGLARAMWVNLKAGGVVQGGSTITQQLAKVLFLSPDRTLERTVQGALLALWLETRFTKDEILSLYLNRVYLGAGTYGVDAAARRYYGKPAERVGLYEAAQLAGLLKAPTRYSPANDPAAAAARTRVVLAAMVDVGYITDDQAAEALASKPAVRALAARRARYFADWIMAQVNDFVGRVDADLTVVTTLDSRIQTVAEQEVEALLDGEGAKRGAHQAAFLALSPDGAVRAMVGGRDYAQSQFNRAVQARRQPGSAFKPFVYLAALENGRRPDHRMVDEPVEVDGWRPRNYAGRYYGEVTLREAFARSLNSVAVRLSEEAGRQRVAEVARRLGISSELEVSPSIALGTSEVSLLELTGSYATFANRGRGVWPYGITEIRDASGRVLYRRQGGGPGRVVGGRAVDQMTDLMTAVVEWGTGKAAKLDRPAAGKTGTSQEFRDAWFVGFTNELVAGAWFGNDDDTPMKQVTGGGLPARLWGRVMTRALAGQPARPLPGGGVEVAASTGVEGFFERLVERLTGIEPGTRKAKGENTIGKQRDHER